MNNVLSFDGLLKSQGIAGWSGDQAVEDLRKALATTAGTAMSNGNYPLMLENLDGMFTEVLTTEKHIKMKNLLPTVPSATPYYEWNKHNGFTNHRGSIGFAQGGAPQGGNSTFSRNGKYVKYLGVKGGITHQIGVVGQNGGAFTDPQVLENRDRTLELLTKLDRELVFGNSAIKDGSGNETNIDGILTWMAANYSQNVIDLGGQPFTYDHLDDSSEDFVTNGKQPSVDGYTALMSPHVVKGLNMQYQSRNIIRRDKAETSPIDFVPGFKVPAYEGQFGTIAFDHSILLERVENSAPPTVAPSGAPASPTKPTAGNVPTAAADTTVHIPANTYYYSVSAFNDYGESLATVCDAVAVADGQKVAFTVAKVTAATGYRVYRGVVSDGSDGMYIGEVAQPTASTFTYTDSGAWGTVDSNSKKANGLTILIKPDARDIAWAQMAPMTRMALPQVDTTFPFLLLLYGVLAVKAPERIRIYKNCGVYSPA